MEHVLKVFGEGYAKWRGLVRPLAKVIGRRVSANTISVLRPFGAPLVVLLAAFDHPGIAVVTYIILALTDALDGAVATARQEMGYQDDPKLGAFMDAFCDKLFWLVIVSGLFSMGSYEHVDVWAVVLFLVACVALVVTEGALAVVRLADYSYERTQNGHAHKERLLPATRAGKLKFVIECIGAGGLVFTQPNLDFWSFYVALGCFVAALPFAIKSLAEKLQARR